MFQHTDTSGDAPRAISPATPSLPDWLTALGPSEDQIRDNGWAGYLGEGYWPQIVTVPTVGIDEVLTDGFSSYTADAAARVWRGVQAKRFLTAAELSARVDELYAYAANVRYEREVGGMLVGGMAVATDDRSKLLLAGARIKAEADPSYTTRWKVSNTDRVDIPAAQIVAMSDAVLAWVDRTFDVYDKVANLIAAGTIRTSAEIDAAFSAELA